MIAKAKREKYSEEDAYPEDEFNESREKAAYSRANVPIRYLRDIPVIYSELETWHEQRRAHFLPNSSAIENVIGDELESVWQECREPNWDGYDALPVTLNAYNNAKRFLLSLPFGVQIPSIGADPDGHITIEWHRSQRRTLSVSISPENELNYAALLGLGNTRGTEPFFGEVPKIIVDLIHRVYSC